MNKIIEPKPKEKENSAKLKLLQHYALSQSFDTLFNKENNYTISSKCGDIFHKDLNIDLISKEEPFILETLIANINPDDSWFYLKFGDGINNYTLRLEAPNNKTSRNSFKLKENEEFKSLKYENKKISIRTYSSLICYDAKKNNFIH